MAHGEDLFERGKVIQRLGDEELFKEIIAVFVETCPKYILQLDNALQNQQWSLVEKIAHKIKGAASNIGSDLVRDNAIAIECAVQKQDFESVTLEFTQLNKNIQKLLTLLDQELKR
jgi:HPt (histidine-containing phosphotransfer) domain-containing protein